MTEFDCTGCERHVIRFTDDADRLCSHCLTLGVERSKLFQDWQDGKISDDEFKRRFEAVRTMRRHRVGLVANREEN